MRTPKKTGRPVVPGLGLQKSTGQYRKVVNGRTIYFGTDPDQALAKYQLFRETGLQWNRGYHQFCLQEGGMTVPLGATMDVARRNHAAFAARQKVDTLRVSPSEWVVNTVREVGDGYLNWLIRNKKNPGYILEVKRAFRELIALPKCGDLPLQQLTIDYFKVWYYHCRERVESKSLQSNWSNRRMRAVKAAFQRVNQLGWMSVALPDLTAMLAVLEQHGGKQMEQEIFTPAELRAILKTARTRERAAILLGLNCAVGNTDMGRLKWSDIVEKHHLGKKEFMFQQARGKTHRKRRTPLWPTTVDTLNKWRTTCLKKGIATGPSNLLFPTEDGAPIAVAGVGQDGEVWRHDALAKAIDAILKNLKIKRPRLAWYSLRHTAATWATDYAGDGSLVGEGNQFLLGQASDVMWKTYSQGVPPSIRRAVEAVWRGLNDGENLVLD